MQPNGWALSCRPQSLYEAMPRAVGMNDSFSCAGIGEVQRSIGQLERLVRLQTPPVWFRAWYIHELMIMHGIPFSEKEPDDKAALADKQSFGNILTGNNPSYFKLPLFAKRIHHLAGRILKRIRHDSPV